MPWLSLHPATTARLWPLGLGHGPRAPAALLPPIAQSTCDSTHVQARASQEEEEEIIAEEEEMLPPVVKKAASLMKFRVERI